MREYGHKGLAGCVEQRKARQTRTVVGIYHGVQSGIEKDPATPWVTVCEEHGACVCHPTLRLARWHASDPQGWCEECRDKAEEKI